MISNGERNLKNWRRVPNIIDCLERVLKCQFFKRADFLSRTIGDSSLFI